MPTNPTGSPSSQPSGQPSNQPSCRPSAIPTWAPLMAGQLRTCRPTSAPTSIPTSKPTAAPTSAPSLTTASVWIQELIPAIQSDFLHGDYLFNYYYDLYVDGINVHGGCTNWLSSRVNEVIIGVSANLIALELVTANDTDVYDEDNATYDLFSCDNVTFLSLYSKLMKDSVEKNIASGVELTCDDALSSRYLKVKNCAINNDISLCINCVDPCDSSRNDYCQSTFLAPCETPFNCSTSGSSVKFYSTKYVPTSTYRVPVVDKFTTSVTESSVKVSIETNSTGFMTCGIFDMHLNSVDSLTTNGFEKAIAVDENNTKTVEFEFKGLMGASIYYVYCRGKSMDGIETPNSDVLDSMNWEISTSCCKSIFVDLASNKFQVTPSWQEAFEIILQVEPPDTLYINVDTSSDTSNNEAFHPLSFQILSTATLPISMTVFVNTSNLFFLYGDITLSHSVELTLSGASASEFKFVYINKRDTFDIISPEVEPDPPVFNSLQYSNDAQCARKYG